MLGAIEDRRILVGGKKRIALLADLGSKESRIENLALLMLFDDEGRAPTLLDAADVGIDRDTGFANQAVLPLGQGDSALANWSEHNSAGLTMGGYMIVSPVGDHLAMVAGQRPLRAGGLHARRPRGAEPPTVRVARSGAAFPQAIGKGAQQGTSG